MKIFFYLAGAALLASCSGSPETPSGGTDSTATETTTIPVDNSILDPITDDLSGEISATDLCNSMRAALNKEVQLIVYPFVYTDGEKFKQDMYGYAEAGATDYAVSMNFTAVPDVAISKTMPYLVKGTISAMGYYNELQMTNVELLDLPADYKVEPFNPKAISNTAIYNPNDIKASMMAWDKKMVTVTGDYYGTTISKNAEGTELLDARVDVGYSSDAIVGCSFATEEETKVFTAGQTGVKVKGELSAFLVFGNPSMKNCVVVQ